ncbi:MerR family transcriptional regulator [Paenibacillus pinihumi]|uniref:helix-turn-helix domain-containing protein n=1 Tax=Paenibacillus pinihumi TaxID=669462 RepID=UPI0004188B0F|nr:MerR family transcriptional regulator [Paenibacillus pinihumi]
MKKELTISELAKLMNVSVHQIRYFEEKGVLYPAYLDENKYRMYGTDQIYRLAHILLLRKMGLSVQAIASWSEDGTPDEMQDLLLQSVSRIESQIDQLQTLSSLIHKVLDEHKRFGQETSSIKIIQRDAFVLSSWFETELEADLDARMLAQQDNVLPELFEADIHYVYEEESRLTICTEVNGVEGNMILPAGEYLSCMFSIQSEADLERHFELFQTFAEKSSFILTGPKILVEKSYLSLFAQESIHYELLACVDRGSDVAIKQEKKR